MKGEKKKKNVKGFQLKKENQIQSVVNRTNYISMGIMENSFHLV